MQPHSTALITDTTCDIPPELVEQYGILLVSQHLIWGTETLVDRVDITHEAFYERLTRDPVHPKTSQATAQDFVQILQRIQEEGGKEAVAILLSSQFSGTINSAQQARKDVDIPLLIVDSRSVAMGLGWQVLAAARTREAGGGAQAMIAAANTVRETLQFILSLDTLEYLHRGGRIGGAAWLVGSALQLKPQLYVDHVTGTIQPGKRTRTRRKALEQIYQSFFSLMAPGKTLHVAVQHTAAQEDAEAMAVRIREEHNPVELLVLPASPVIGVHAGPGGVGICGYYET